MDHGAEYQAFFSSISFKTASFRLIKINPRPFLSLLPPVWSHMIDTFPLLLSKHTHS